MTATLPAPTLPPGSPAHTVEWELHRPRRGRPTATAFYGPAECVHLSGPLLHLRVAVWTRRLHRLAALHQPVPAHG